MRCGGRGRGRGAWIACGTSNIVQLLMLLQLKEWDAAIARGEAAPVQREMARGAFGHYCAVWDRLLRDAG